MSFEDFQTGSQLQGLLIDDESSSIFAPFMVEEAAPLSQPDQKMQSRLIVAADMRDVGRV